MRTTTRSKTKQAPARRSSPKDRQAQPHASEPPAALPQVEAEELSRLAGDLAYFRAARYRDVEAGEVREEDVERAKEEVAAMLRRDDSE